MIEDGARPPEIPLPTLKKYNEGLGGVWLGEILKSAKEVRELCGLSNDRELMAVVSLGHPAGKGEPEAGGGSIAEGAVKKTIRTRIYADSL